MAPRLCSLCRHRRRHRWPLVASVISGGFYSASCHPWLSAFIELFARPASQARTLAPARARALLRLRASAAAVPSVRWAPGSMEAASTWPDGACADRLGDAPRRFAFGWGRAGTSTLDHTRHSMRLGPDDGSIDFQAGCKRIGKMSFEVPIRGMGNTRCAGSQGNCLHERAVFCCHYL